MAQMTPHRGIHGVRTGIKRRGLRTVHRSGDGISLPTMSRDRIGTIISGKRVPMIDQLSMNRKKSLRMTRTQIVIRINNGVVLGVECLDLNELQCYECII